MLSSLLLVILYNFDILSLIYRGGVYNNEYYLIVYVFDSNMINTDITINTTNNIINENLMFKFYKFFSQCDNNYCPSYFVRSNFDTRSSFMFNLSENLKYKNSTILSVLEYRSKIEQECRLKLEKVYRLKLEEHDEDLAK